MPFRKKPSLPNLTIVRNTQGLEYTVGMGTQIPKE